MFQLSQHKKNVIHVRQENMLNWRSRWDDTVMKRRAGFGKKLLTYFTLIVKQDNKQPSEKPHTPTNKPVCFSHRSAANLI